MSENTIEKLKGKNCKIVMIEPNKNKATVIFGFLRDIDYKKDFVILESVDGLKTINKNSIIAIKPTIIKRK